LNLNRGTPLTRFDSQSLKHGEIKRESRGSRVASPSGEERGSLSYYFSKTGSTGIFVKTLNNSILYLFRIVDFPVQQDAVVNAG
jgi:hypothetical protein